MSLAEMEARGELTGQATPPEELESLLRMALRRAGDASIMQLSPESRIVNAYQCVLACAKAALRSKEYRVPDSGRQHYLMLETLRFTLGLSDGEIRYFQVLRRKRHKDEYEGTLEVSDTEADEAATIARQLVEAVQLFLER
jgi:uncharacterized protein (UPF0332 family)